MGELREGEAFPRGGGMRTARQNDFILHEGQVMQVRTPCGAFHDAELHGFILHGLFDFLRIAAFQPYAYFRIMAVEQGQQRRQDVLGHGGAGSQAQFTGNGRIPAGRHVFRQRFIFLEDAAGMDQQAHAFRRQGDAAAFPFEQAGVQQAFQLLDMPGDGRLRDEQLLRRAREVQAPRDGLKHFQPEIRNHGEGMHSTTPPRSRQAPFLHAVAR